MIGLVLIGVLLFGGKKVLESHAEDERERQKREEVERKGKEAVRRLDEDYAQLQQRNRQKALEGPLYRGSDGGVTLSTYLGIRDGMSYEEVSRILGKPGTPAASSDLPGIVSTEVYNWTWEASGAVVTCSFQDGRLVVKAQAGLR